MIIRFSLFLLLCFLLNSTAYANCGVLSTETKVLTHDQQVDKIVAQAEEKTAAIRAIGSFLKFPIAQVVEMSISRFADGRAPLGQNLNLRMEITLDNFMNLSLTQLEKLASQALETDDSLNLLSETGIGRFALSIIGTRYHHSQIGGDHTKTYKTFYLSTARHTKVESLKFDETRLRVVISRRYYSKNGTPRTKYQELIIKKSLWLPGKFEVTIVEWSRHFPFAWEKTIILQKLNWDYHKQVDFRSKGL